MGETGEVGGWVGGALRTLLPLSCSLTGTRKGNGTTTATSTSPLVDAAAT